MTMSWIYSFVKINFSSAVYHFFLYTNRTVILFFKCQKNFGSALYTCIVSLYNNRTVILFFRVSNMQCTILYCSKPFIYFDDHTIMQTQQKNNNLIVNHWFMPMKSQLIVTTQSLLVLNQDHFKLVSHLVHLL